MPVAVWSGLFVADVLMRKSYAETDLFYVKGRYGAYNFKSIGLVLFGTIIGWGLVTNSLASWLSWARIFTFSFWWQRWPMGICKSWSNSCATYWLYRPQYFI